MLGMGETLKAGKFVDKVFTFQAISVFFTVTRAYETVSGERF